MSILTTIPPLSAFNYVLRYQNDDFGAHYSITGRSYDEVVESRAIYCKFDDRTTHTLFVVGEVAKSYMLSGMPGWADVTAEFMKEMKELAVTEALGEETSDMSHNEDMVFMAISQADGIGKRDAIAVSGISDDDWLPTIRSLLERGKISKEGVGKYTKYRAS